jgi:hypothetical protein
MAKRSSDQGHTVDTGRVLRPKAVVLGDEALVPEHSMIHPPPNRFTHEIERSQPYYYDEPGGTPAGRFAAGTEVVLMRDDGGDYCRVVDARGLYVTTARGGLRRI